MFIPTVTLAAVLLVVAGALAAHSRIADRQYLREIEAEIAKLEPQAKRAAALDRQIEQARNRSRLLDEFRGRTTLDLDTLNELSKLLPPPTWTNMIELARDTATISGEADRAAPLLRILDASPYFQNSEFTGITKTGNAEMFRIRTVREKQR